MWNECQINKRRKTPRFSFNEQAKANVLKLNKILHNKQKNLTGTLAYLQQKREKGL